METETTEQKEFTSADVVRAAAISSAGLSDSAVVPGMLVAGLNKLASHRSFEQLEGGLLEFAACIIRVQAEDRANDLMEYMRRGGGQ